MLEQTSYKRIIQQMIQKLKQNKKQIVFQESGILENKKFEMLNRNLEKIVTK